MKRDEGVRMKLGFHRFQGSSSPSIEWRIERGVFDALTNPHFLQFIFLLLSIALFYIFHHDTYSLTLCSLRSERKKTFSLFPASSLLGPGGFQEVSRISPPAGSLFLIFMMASNYLFFSYPRSMQRFEFMMMITIHPLI